MFEGEDIAFNGLEVCSYRHLQGMAKKMGLPSNVKKVHLIEMIRAKKYCTETDLQAIVNRVKMERKVNAQAKKKKPRRKPYGLQGAEISSTSNSHSPHIMSTPKHPSEFIIQYSPDITQTIMKYQPKPNILCSTSSIHQPFKRHMESDRVLRSFNSVKKPNYRIMEQNECIDLIAESSVQEIQEDTQEHNYQSLNLTVQKPRPTITATVFMNPERQLVPMSRSCNTTKPAKRQRKLSGIYPLQAQDKPIYKYVPTVGFRRTDGRVSKINAVIQKPLASTLLPKNKTIKISKKSLIPRNQLVSKSLQQTVLPKRRTLTVQDMINYKVDHQSIDINKERIEPNAYEDSQSEVDRQISAQRIDDRTIECNNEISYVTSDLYSMPTGIRNADLNPSRKVYKGQRDNSRWNYNIDQDNDTSKKEWTLYDINGQSLYKTDHNTHDTEPTNYRIPQGRTIEPSSNYEVEYQKFNQEKERFNQEITRFDHHRQVNEGITFTLNKNYGAPDIMPNTVITNKEANNNRCTQNQTIYEQQFNTNANLKYNIQDKMNNIQNSKSVIQNRNDRPIPTDIRSEDRSLDRSDDLRSQYPNMSALTEVFPNDYQNKESNYSVYYHKKIRAEMKNQKDKEQLPKIADVFSQFNDVQYKNLTQPLFVHVGGESQRVPVPAKLPANYNNTCMLETIYNFKNQFVTNPPVLLIATTQTYCTYSTKTISSAIAQPAAEYCNNMSERANLYQESTNRVNDYLKPPFRPTPDFVCDEVLSSSTASLETNSQELGANVTIPEMVEDALELISQDGDYMERIGMDVRVQCMLCEWAGPKIILEYHIKKEHSNEIQHETGTECSVLLSLGELTADMWRGQLLRHGDTLYVLSAKWTGDTLLVAVSMVPSETEFETKRARITVYNKRTGQPFSYESCIKDIPDSMPYDYDLDCLTLDVSKLDLIPNSANLKLVNRELVGSPKKAVVGTELKNVEIVVYVKFID